MWIVTFPDFVTYSLKSILDVLENVALDMRGIVRKQSTMERYTEFILDKIEIKILCEMG